MAVNSALGEGSFRINASDKHLEISNNGFKTLEEALVGQIETPFSSKRRFRPRSLFYISLPKLPKLKKKSKTEILKWRQEEKINEELYYSITTVYFVNRKMWNYQWPNRFCRWDKRTGYIVLYCHKTGRKSRLVYIFDRMVHCKVISRKTCYVWKICQILVKKKLKFVMTYQFFSNLHGHFRQYLR